MIEIKVWMSHFIKNLQGIFPGRIEFVGLQGSYGRNEATDSSDIDVVVILNELLPEDLKIYSCMLDNLPNRNLICGFISGKAELMNWEPSDLFQFFYDTTPIIGNLDELYNLIDDKAVKQAVLIGSCNIYHACVHNMVHEKDFEILKGLYKSAAFVIQAIYYCETGNYIKKKSVLLSKLSEPEYMILENSMQLKDSEIINDDNFDRLSAELFKWAQDLINNKTA